jgi:signal transduction histidine kinase
VIANSIQILHPEAVRRNVLVTSQSASEELPVRADKIHIQQVILNLATNAMDAMIDVPAQKKLVFQSRLTDASKVEVAISDTGRGIPIEKLVSVFEPFYTTKQSGTGLGLSIAQMIVETYAGRIWADNKPEGGAVMRFDLPLARNGYVQ